VGGEVTEVKTMSSRMSWAALACAAVVAAGCAGDDASGFPDLAEPATSEPESDAEEPAEAATMPDVVGQPADEAVAELEELGFQVTTGVVRTTEMEPDLVYRSEPAAGRRVQEGQRVTLRIAAEPRQ
jgi:hypothetical protein